MKKPMLFMILVISLLLPAGNTRPVQAAAVPTSVSSYYMSGEYYTRLTETLNAYENASQRDRLVAVAMSQAGYRAGTSITDIAGYGNASKAFCEYTDWFYRSNMGDKRGLDWCAAFVSWCGAMAGIPTSVIPHNAVALYLRVGTVHKVWTDDFSTYIDYRPKKGDLMFAMPLNDDRQGHRNGWDRSAHVAIVAEDATTRRDGGWNFVTIERNGNTVGQRSLYTTIRAGGTSVTGTHYVQMFVTPDYQVDTSHDPKGWIDGVSSDQPGSLAVRGWAFDVDAPADSVKVHVYVGGEAGSGAPSYEITADVNRPDVNDVFSLTGKHGYDTTLKVGLSGEQTVYFYAINMGSGENNTYLGCETVNIPADTEKPKISNAAISNITPDGYVVTCKVSDNVGIASVKFPTWTISGDQDDIVWHEGTVSGNTASCRVKRSEHNYEYGDYVTHIYAYDLAGNFIGFACDAVTVSNCAAGHSWDAGKVTKPATTGAAGIKTYTCMICKRTKKETIPKLRAEDQPTPTDQAPAVKTIEKNILSMKGDEAPEGARFKLLQLQASGVTQKTVQLKWQRVKGASGYIIYGNLCGKKNQRIKVINQGTQTSWTHKNLKKGKFYKYFIVATAKKGNEKRVIATSTMIHVTTRGGKYGNYKAVKLKNYKNKSVTLTKGNSITIKAGTTVAGSKVKEKKHRALRFESSNEAVAVVGEKTGRVRAKKTGKCYVYVYAQNGVFQRVRVIVK